MNQNLLPACIGLCLLATITACTPDHADSPHDADPTLLEQVFVAETMDSHTDTTYRYDISYDEQKRVSDVHQVGLKNLNPYDSTVGLQMVFRYFYEGDAVWPSLVTKNGTQPTSPYEVRDSLFFKYNSGRLIFDSAIQYFNPGLVTRLSYSHLYSDSGSYLHVHSLYWDESGAIDYNFPTNLTMTTSNGNILTLIKLDPPDIFNQYFYQAEYTSSPDPFYKFAPPMYGDFMSIENYFPLNGQPNLRSHAAFGNSASDLNVTIAYNHTLRADGYPLTSEVNKTSYHTVKYIFFYQH